MKQTKTLYRVGETGGEEKEGGRIQKGADRYRFPTAVSLARLQRVSGYLRPEEGDAARLITGEGGVADLQTSHSDGRIGGAQRMRLTSDSTQCF